MGRLSQNRRSTAPGVVSLSEQDGAALVEQAKAGDGEFDHPNDVVIDRDGRLFVADMGNDDMQVFGQDGRLGVGVGAAGMICVSDSQRVRALQLVLAFGDE